MSDTSKRPWFRFHLLTAVLMMLGAGGVLGMNIQHPESIKFEQKVNGRTHSFTTLAPGWPFRLEALDGHIRPTKGTAQDYLNRFATWHMVLAIAVNMTIVLVPVASICEFILRRREGRRS